MTDLRALQVPGTTASECACPEEMKQVLSMQKWTQCQQMLLRLEATTSYLTSVYTEIFSELANCEQNPKIFIDAVNLTCKPKSFQTSQDKQTKNKTS